MDMLGMAAQPTQTSKREFYAISTHAGCGWVLFFTVAHAPVGWAAMPNTTNNKTGSLPI